MTVGSLSNDPPLPRLTTSVPPVDGDRDGDKAPESAGAQAADASSGLPFDPARGRNVNIIV